MREISTDMVVNGEDDAAIDDGLEHTGGAYSMPEWL